MKPSNKSRCDLKPHKVCSTATQNATQNVHMTIARAEMVMDMNDDVWHNGEMYGVIDGWRWL